MAEAVGCIRWASSHIVPALIGSAVTLLAAAVMTAIRLRHRHR